MSAETVKTRLYIISDTHSRSDGRSISQTGSFRPPFPKADILLHSGDLTMTGTLDQNRQALKLLSDIPAELKLVIAGNHDLTLDKPYYLKDRAKSGTLWAGIIDGFNYAPENPDKVLDIWTGDEAKQAGVTYLTEGLHTFKLSNGAKFTIYASPWQPEFGNWAFNYPHQEDRWNPPEMVEKKPFPGNDWDMVIPAPPERDPHPIPKDAKVDIVMTHGPPWMHLDLCKSGQRAGCPQLLLALDRIRPKLHCFGHIHEGWGAERITWKERYETEIEKEEGEELGKVGEVTEVLGGMKAPSSTIQTPEDMEVNDRRAAYLDVSQSSENPLKAGKETVLVNSCIMNQRYSPEGAGWLVDLELPLKQH